MIKPAISILGFLAILFVIPTLLLAFGVSVGVLMLLRLPDSFTIFKK